MRARYHVALISLTAGLLGTADVNAQQAGGGQGAATAPAPVAAGTVWLADDQFVRWPYSDPAYTKVDGFKLKEYVNQIVAISRKSRDAGDQLWGRIMGTPYDKMTTDWVAAQFLRLGLEQVRAQPFTLPTQWLPTSWDIVAAGAGASVPIRSAMPLYLSVATTAPLALEPVWLGTGTAADFMAQDVRGKAAVLYGFPNPGGRNNSALSNGALRRADEAGAAAILIVLGFPGNVKNVPRDAASGPNPPARVPAFVIGNDDGTAIREMIEKKQSPTIQMRLSVDMRDGLTSDTIWGVLPGTTDENIVVMAHTDAYFDGASDNASGMATMIAIAEYYARVPRSQRRRSITFLTTTHHSPTGPDAGIRWIHSNMTDMWAKTALIVNCEHTAQVAVSLVGNALITSNQVAPRLWYVGGGSRLKAIVAKSFKDYGMALFPTPSARPGGELSQVYTDAPSFHIIDQGYFHTDMDSPQSVPAFGLEQSARAFLRIIDETNEVDLRELRADIPSATTN